MSDLKNNLGKQLQDFGLSPTEAIIYIYLLERGTEAGGSSIATGTKLHRQYVYLALPHLIELGLIEEMPKGKQNRYRAQPPATLELWGRKKAVEATELARALDVISNIGNEQAFEVLQGVHSIRQYEFAILDQSKPGDTEYIIGGATINFCELMGESFEEYLETSKRAGLIVKYLGGSSEVDFFRKHFGSYTNQEYRFMNKMPEGVTHTVIRKESVCFYSFLKPPLVYVIKSPVVADHYRRFFMMLWDMADTV